MYAYIHNNMIYYSNDFVKKKKKISLLDIFTIQGKTIF